MTAAAAGAAGEGETPVPPAPNYEVTGTWPEQPVALLTQPGQLKYTKLVIHSQFLAESCSIGDYNEDGAPDVSSGRIWYEGPDFKKTHPFRDGHGTLPREGASLEANTGVSDDWADYPFDVNRDGHVDIINIAQTDVPEANDPGAVGAAGTPNKIGTVQPHASAYWYENPGPAGQAGDPKWVPHLIHSDVRHEQHGLVDMDGDGYPEIFGACKECLPPMTKGFYSGEPKFPTAQWFYHPVSGNVPFPAGLGKLHGLGAGDLNGDGLPDLLSREGAWLQQPGGYFNQTECLAKNTPAGCGFIKQAFGDGQLDGTGEKGGSHMFAVDMDQDGIADVVSADWAHGEGLAWYKQSADGTFTKYYFMHTHAEASKFGGVYFTEPHALQVVDMDGDGRPDVVTGKFRFSQPLVCNDPDPNGVPYIYVFKNVAEPDANTGAPITLEPVRVDPLGVPGAPGSPEGGMGVGHQLAIGHVNTDGILDICVATKVGLAVFLGQ